MPQQPEGPTMPLPDFTDVLKETEQILRECFSKYDLDEVFLSFNGGKDCTALLDITINVIKDLCKREDAKNNLKIVYIRTKGPFREIEDFIKETEAHYGIRLKEEEGDMKDTLDKLMKQDERLKACLMGTRRTDPFSSNLSHMQYTDEGWPKMMRVSPLLNWSYHQIWSYILQRQVPYCCLYDKGYTSIGSTQNTWPNPALLSAPPPGGLGGARYRPAWALPDEALERVGRGKQKPVLAVVANLSKTNGSIHSL